MRQFVRDLLHHAARPSASALPRRQTCDWIAIDFETANGARGSACAVGVAMFKDGWRIGGGATLINPQTDFSPYNSMVNGIDETVVARAPTFAQVWPDLAPLLEGQHVVAHNAAFDLSVLRSTAARYEVKGVAFDAFCTYRLAKAAFPGMESYSLGWLALHLNLADFEHHQAGDDATAAGWVAAKICEKAGLDLVSAAEQLRFMPGRITADSYIAFAALHAAGKLTGRLADDDADPEGPLYGLSVCFTGTLASMPRAAAADLVCAAGADFKNSVGKKLDYLVIGDADFVAFADGWATGKLSRARELIAEGAEIEIIPEREFLHLLGPH